MALNETKIESAGKAPAQAKEKPKAKDEPGSDLPTEVRSNPVVKQVLVGSVPGVLFRPGVYYPKAAKLGKHIEDLMDVGMDFYKAFDSSFVFFNPRSVTEAQLRKADEEGQLAALVPDYEVISGEAPGTPPEGWAEELAGVNTESASTMLPGTQKTTPMANASPAGAPTGAEDAKLAAARAKNLLPGAPTTGPRPGAGRVLNNLAKPVV